MTRPTFSHFVILAGMRTGSNLLEERLNAIDGLKSFGEVFNPAFAGHAGKSELFGMTPKNIAADPAAAISRLQSEFSGLPGFRLFRGHNDKALELCLSDPACAKIVLRRNPAESYVSLKIATQTDQWRMQDVRSAKTAKAHYDGAEFRTYLEDNRAYYDYIGFRLKSGGQTAFSLDYDDLNDPRIIEGLARFLGIEVSGASRKVKTKKQNPEPFASKVANFDDMLGDIRDLDMLGLLHDPSFEPARGPDVKGYLVHASVPLVFMPIAGGPTDEIRQWMSRLTNPDDLQSGLNQREMREWKRLHPGHRGFVVLRHPLLRAWDAYTTHLVQPGPSLFQAIRRDLEKMHDLKLPEPAPLDELDPGTLATGFLGFLDFIRLNLSGQTMIRVDASWATLSSTIAGISAFAAPHLLITEDEMPEMLQMLAQKLGVAEPPKLKTERALSNSLGRIISKDIEDAAKAAYQRDYTNFGFGPWQSRSA